MLLLWSFFINPGCKTILKMLLNPNFKELFLSFPRTIHFINYLSLSSNENYFNNKIRFSLHNRISSFSFILLTEFVYSLILPIIGWEIDPRKSLGLEWIFEKNLLYKLRVKTVHVMVDKFVCEFMYLSVI